ncbi:unnamed protein product [Moneuplotes crassus]|uniref:Uncharacterized protein n=1 Tax=Euplotes crassus TaxID=5936 RepID=A0AAD1UEN9_EUPCR|nr:unnamed protein product [Moneuplotes crassus]
MIKTSYQEKNETNTNARVDTGNHRACTQILTSMCFQVQSEKEIICNNDDFVPSEGIPLVVNGTSSNESKLLNDKGKVKLKDFNKFNLSGKSPLKQILCPTTQDHSALGGIEQENKFQKYPNAIKTIMKKSTMKRHKKVYSDKFAKLRGMFKSEVVKKPLSILNKLDSARILKEIGKADD